ncbi:MAG TPA: hypothetical protein VHT27_00005, partial [Solirubrobacteraceae bacterium]|nr:hypothetical protein [Solirubrobacteraceae bacterium]
MVSGITVSIAPTNAGAEYSVYKLKFKVAAGLTAGEGVIHIQLPVGGTFGACESVEVNDGAKLASAGWYGCGSEEVTVYAPYAISAGDTLEVVLHGVTNPPTKTASATVEVWTSADTTKAASSAFEITAPTAVSAVTASAAPTNAGAEYGVYKVKFKATSALGSYVGKVHIQLPAGATFADCESIEVIDGVSTSGSYWYGCSGEEVVVYAPFAIAAGDSVEVVLHGVINPPAKTASAKIEVWTSTDVVHASSPAFEITAPTAVSAVTASPAPTNAGAEYGVYKVKFKATSALPYYAGKVHIQLPGGARFGDCESVEVIDGASSTSATYWYGCSGEEVVVYAPFAIAAGDSVEVVLHGVINP